MFKKEKKLLIYGLVLLLVLALTGAAWGAPADTKSSEQKSTNAQLTSVFKDVQAGDSNLVYINYLAKREIISGFADGGFHPGEGLSRAQAATLLVKAAGLSGTEKKVAFKDVYAGHWAAANIAVAAEAGYLKGYPDGTYHPEEKLSRAQGISLVLRLSKQKDTGAELTSLKDLDSKHWAARSVAIGLAAGMVGLSNDKTQFLPDADFSRGDLSRALAVLLTSDPDLSQTFLTGSLEIKKGEVKINDMKVTGTILVKAGDLITTSAEAEAQLSYPDGSGLLIKENSQLTVKETRGRAYIKKDGSPGTAVDWLLFDLKKGNIFGALATKPNVKEEKSEKKTSGLGEKLLAGISNALEYLAVGEKELPWYQSAETKKVKVRIDMPYGVAAVRGSFWGNAVTDNGCSTSLLEGDAEISAGGKTEALPPGKSSAVTQTNPVPTPPTPMTAAQVTTWVQQASWLQNVVQTIQNNQEAVKTEATITVVTPAPFPGQPNPIAPLVQVPTAPVTPTPAPVIPDIMTLVNQALTQVQQAAGFTNITNLVSPTTGSLNTVVPSTQTTTTTAGGDTSTTTESSTRKASWTAQALTSLPNGSQTLVLTKEFGTITPSTLGTATRYQLLGKDSGNNYRPLTGILPLSQKSVQLAKIFEVPTNLMVKFFNDKYECIGNYRLDSNGVLTNLANKTISGTISLPAGEVAPAEGIGMVLRVSGLYIGGWNDFYQDSFIPAGAGSTTYSIAVPDNLDSSNLYSVNFHLKGEYQGSYVRPGHYASMVNVIDGSKSNIDMNIVQGKIVSGKIILPQPNNSGSEITIGVQVHKSGEDGYYKVTKPVIIPIGASEAAFDWVVESGYSYKIRYGIEDGKLCSDNHYLPFAYYSTSGTVVKKENATPISVSNQDISGIDIPVKTGYRISGTMHLPPGEIAPAGGLKVTVSTDVNGLGPADFNNWVIPEGQNYAGYALVVPSGTYNIYLQPHSDFYYVGNYRGGLTVSNSDLNGIDYQLSKNPEADPWAAPEVGNFPTIAPVDIANNSLVLAGTAVALDSPAFSSDNLLNILSPATSLFYKSASGQWYDLRTGSTVTNPPPIFYYLNGQINLNVGNQESVYPTNCYYPRHFTVSPLNAQVSASSNNPSLFRLEIQPGNNQGKIWAHIATGNTTGSASATITASATGYTNYSHTYNLNVVPYLTNNNHDFEAGYNSTGLTVSNSVYGVAQWNSSDIINLELYNLNTGMIVENSASFLTNPSVTNAGISFMLAPGLKPSAYGLKAVKNSAVIGVSTFAVHPPGNRMYGESATYNSSSGRLTIQMGWSESASFDFTKFVIKTSSGETFNLSNSYNLVSDYGAVLSPGQYTLNNGLIIVLNAADKTAIGALPNLGSGNLSINLLQGWATDTANNPAYVDNATPVTLVTTT
ncbi:MAG: S-layer homology domain-containing protein [Syntrophomonas sp.]